MPTKSQILNTNPEAVLDLLDGWKKTVDTLEQQAETYRRYVQSPGGASWEGLTAEAAQNCAQQDYRAVVAAHDTVYSRAGQIANTVSSSLMPPLSNAKQIIYNAEASAGVTVHEDLSMTYTAPEGTSNATAEANQKTVAAAEAELKADAAKWWAAENDVAQQIRATETAVGKDLNFGAALGDVSKAFGVPPEVLEQPLPTDPRELAALWSQLTPEQKDQLYRRDHNLGNHSGLPAVDRDHYNQDNLRDQLGSAQAAAAQADALQAQHPDWAQGKNIPPRNEPGAIFAERSAYEAWQRQYDAARNGAKNLPDLQAVQKAVSASPDRKLMLLDTQTGKQARAAIAVGDPDKATHVSVTTPGLNTTVHGAIGDMTNEATHLRTEAQHQLSLTSGHEHDGVSAIAWIGYDPPQVPGLDHPGASLTGGWGVSHDDIARSGAHDLAGFYDGIQAAHQNGPADLTAIGHSYGSLTTGLALQEPGDHGVSRALFYGSPGIEATTPQDLHLQPGHVYAMETPNDPIQMTYDAPPLAHALAPILPPPLNLMAEGVLGAADVSGAGHFGPNPATNPNFNHLATGPSVIPDGHGGTLNLEGAQGHSDYPRFPEGGGQRTTNYNIAAILAGLGDHAVPQK